MEKKTHRYPTHEPYARHFALGFARGRGGGGGTALYSSGGGCYIGLKRKNEKREIDSHKPVPVLMTLAKADIQAVAAAVEVSCATDAHAQSVSALVNYWPTTRRVSFTECFNN